MPRIQGFSGIAPRFTSRSLPPNFATISRNTKLYNNELRAWLRPSSVNTALLAGDIQSIYFLNLVDRGAWLSFAEHTDVVRGFLPDDERFFFLQNGQLRYSEFGLITGSTFVSYPVGVEAPMTAPTLVLGAGGDPALTPEAKAYVYTWVTIQHEESMQSLPSEVITIQPGRAVVLSGFDTPPANALTMRIYRTLTGDTKTSFFFVDELPATSTTYTDTKTNLQLAEVLVSQNFTPPPQGLEGLAAMGNGFMAAFRGNELWFSEPNQPHAWPLAYRKIIEFPIVAIESFGATYGSDIANTLCIGTTGYPHLARGNKPIEIVVNKLPDPQPCISRRSMVNAETGVMYASTDGLMFVGADRVGIITNQVVEREEWQRFNPTTIHGHIFNGRYFGWFESNGIDEGFVFDFNDRATGVDSKDRFYTLDFPAMAAHADPEIELHYVTVEAGQNVLKRWEGGSYPLKYHWKSKRFVTPGLTSFGAAKVVNDNPRFNNSEIAARTAYFAFIGARETGIVDGDQIGESTSKLSQFILAFPHYAPYVAALLIEVNPITFRIYLEGNLRYQREILHSEPFRLPSGFKGLEWEVEVEGTVPIREIQFEGSIGDMIQGGGDGT